MNLNKQEAPLEPQKPHAFKSEELVRQGMLTSEEANRSLASQFGMAVYPDLSSYRLSREQQKKVPYAFVKKNFVMPFKEEGGFILVAVSDPLNLEPLEEIRLMLDTPVKAVYTPKDAILNAINEAYRKETGSASEMIAHMGDRGDEGRDEVEVYDLLDDSTQQAPIIKLLKPYPHRSHSARGL